MAGVTEPTAIKVLKDPGSRNMMREMKWHFADDIAEIFRKSLKSLEKDLEAAKTISERQKLRDEVLRLLSYGEIASTTQTAGVVQAGAAPGAAPAVGGTLGDILVQYAQQSVTMHGPAPASQPDRIEAALEPPTIDMEPPQ